MPVEVVTEKCSVTEFSETSRHTNCRMLNSFLCIFNYALVEKFNAVKKSYSFVKHVRL